MFSSGQDIAGVQFEKQMRHNSEDVCNTFTLPSHPISNAFQAYIRDIYKDNLGTIVLTIRREQAVFFAQIESFHVDLSFKRVGYGFHELIFVGFHQEHGKRK